jgi:hypothetical protein
MRRQNETPGDDRQAIDLKGIAISILASGGGLAMRWEAIYTGITTVTIELR